MNVLYWCKNIELSALKIKAIQDRNNDSITSCKVGCTLH